MTLLARVRSWSWRRIVGTLAFGIALLLTLIALFYAIKRWRWRTAWEAYASEARQRGVPLNSSYTTAPDVSDELNAAKVSFFTAGLSSGKEIFGILKGTEIFSSRESQRRGDMAAAKRSLLNQHLIEDDDLPAEKTMLQLFEREFSEPIRELMTAANRPYFQSPLTNVQGVS